MKITSVEVSPLSDDRRAEPLIILRTDSARSGTAEIPKDGLPDGVEWLTSGLAALLVGRDPFDLQALARDAAARDEPEPFESAVVAAAGTAMADIAGQELGVPVHQLLGGRVRDRVRACAIGWGNGASSIDALRAAARDVVQQGFTAMRVEPFAGWLEAEADDLSGATEIVRAIREDLPDAIDLVVEGSALVDANDALAFAERVKPLEVLWVEQPTQHLSSTALQEIGCRCPVPLAAARGTSEGALRSLVMGGVVDHVVVDVGLVGGLIAARRIAALAEIYHIGIVPTGLGPVSLATALHLAAAIPNLTMVEMRPGAASVEDGMVAIDLRPGLGVAPEWASVEVV